MHRAIDGCARVYFGMSVSADYLTATVNTAAVARHHGVEAFVNMSQMTVTQMSITESTREIGQVALHDRGAEPAQGLCALILPAHHGAHLMPFG
jgi:hypothetical protein